MACLWAKHTIRLFVPFWFENSVLPLPMKKSSWIKSPESWLSGDKKKKSQARAFLKEFCWITGGRGREITSGFSLHHPIS